MEEWEVAAPLPHLTLPVSSTKSLREERIRGSRVRRSVGLKVLGVRHQVVPRGQHRHPRGEAVLLLEGRRGEAAVWCKQPCGVSSCVV